jgi:hypothetical protein
MNVPLDRLYYFINNVAQEIYGDRVIIYRFWPHGSKNINDLDNLNDYGHTSLGHDEWAKKTTSPLIWCNDQEPLNFDYYRNNLRNFDNYSLINLLKSINCFLEPTNLNWIKNIFEKSLLLHSEKRSNNLKKYEADNELIPVYYWSHALIARDWFRYAEHETFNKNPTKTFLVYNRAWSGTREYRLQFAELIVRLGLENHCRMGVNPVEPELGIHYELHKFKNPIWRPQTVLENHFPVNSAHSYSSADFDTHDYNSTDIEVVLETLFDDDRLHLTEKSLRPIACAQPFILAGTQGSLEYLRSYGFKTFGHIWDERYDLVEDPLERLARIADLMRYIANWTPEQKANKMAQAQAIANYNRQHFFSKEFFDLIVNELKVNLTSAFNELESCNNYTAWLNRWQKLITYPEIIEYLETNQVDSGPTKSKVDLIIMMAQHKLAKKNS